MFDLLQSLLHIDVTLLSWAQQYGTTVYFILFCIIFCETGLVLTPFLPGDSLLFAVGALAAGHTFIEVEQIIPLLIIAAVCGDSVNFFIGQRWGIKLFEMKILFLKPKYLKMTEEFFEKKGTWAVSLSRFFPIIRTFSPFFAGISRMKYFRFLTLSVIGSVVWVSGLTMAGYYFGQIELVKKNFTVLVASIVLFSMLPVFFTAIKAKFVKNN